MTPKHVGIISTIEPNSIAEDLGWRVGDEIVSINGHELHDVIDYRFYSADEFLTVTVRRRGEVIDYELEKDFDLPLGVEFKEVLFDGVRTCGAHCIFCFVEQLPKGLRKALYLKDDDFRLSFLDGNFITLANLTDSDINRIIEQRLSPLYVSVHTTEQNLREKMLGRDCPGILEQIDRLSEGRISLHTQIVLCRGINDAEHLDRTVDDLSGRYPTVQSIATVPAGITGHRRHPIAIPAIDPAYSAGILRKVTSWQRRFLSEHGTRLIWPADEFYLNAGQRIPSARTYEGYPQIENGIGLVRQFLDSAAYARRLLRSITNRRSQITNVVTGQLAAPLLQSWARTLPDWLTIHVHPITNRLFGETVTVTGLLAGQDIIGQLKDRELGDTLVIPSVALRDSTFLDDVTVTDLEAALNTRVIVVDPLPHKLIRAILSLPQPPTR